MPDFFWAASGSFAGQSVRLRQSLPQKSPFPLKPTGSLFLQAQGFVDCHLLSMEEIQLPTAAKGACADYAVLQETQHLPLSAHFGETVT
ncbi:MAG: hypothetical protein LUC50_01605 [Ruminococcus sp.]|nr:hypothetical protein [Ruminococcus sp.]